MRVSNQLKVKNLTPHPVTIVRRLPNGHIITLHTFPPSGEPVRLVVRTVRCGNINGIPLSRTMFGEPVNLPEQERGVLLIVSQLVKNTCPWRRDLVVPAEVVRNDRGAVVGCMSLGL